MRIARPLLVRLLQLLATLWILSVLVFAGGQLLPGDVGRAILGPFADARAVEALNHQLGADRPVLVQYWDWLSHAVQGDFGTSLAFRRPVAPFVATALENSLKLAAVVLAVVVPLGIAGGVVAALRAGRPADRAISLFGLSTSVIPEFVSSLLLIMAFGIWLRWLSISATAPAGAGIGTQITHLILPALPLVLVLFGYIARMARAGTVEALAADYTRTAVLKGLPQRTVVWRHVLRNALTPTIAVIFTQAGNLIGGLVVVETLSRYQGIGGLIYGAAKTKDFPMLEAGVLVAGAAYAVAGLIGDVVATTLDPRLRRAAA